VFEKSKFRQHLANLEAAAGILPSRRCALAQMAATSGLLDDAIRFSRTSATVLKEKLRQYRDTSRASAWLRDNLERVQAIFENVRLRDFVFEPFKDVFNSPTKTLDAHIYSVITQVAVINAVLAGLPGRMGVGVCVVMALEGWMAYRIARHVGISVSRPSDIWKYFGVIATTTGIILYAFRSLLGFAFSLFSVVPGVNPLILAEFFVTDLVGILFLIGFTEAKSHGSFVIPKRMFVKAATCTTDLFEHQLSILRNVLSPRNIKTVAERVSLYLRGEFPVNMRQVNGEVFATAAMAYLIAGQYEKLDGPLGEAFLKAIRLRWSAQLGPDATTEEIATLFRAYGPEQLNGAINTIKGKMFEVLVSKQENQDADRWQATMHTDESFPGSDIIFSNQETGERLEVSLKAVSEENVHIIEHALGRYPDAPIMTTDEAAALYEDDIRVFGSGVNHENLHNITQENFDKIISSIEPVDAHQVMIGSVTVGTGAALWPFGMAYLRGRITRDQLEEVFEHVLGKAGVALASRLVYATVFGPLFVWYMLARGVKGIVQKTEPEGKEKVSVTFSRMRG
jgi:hypothetical protein